MDIIPVDIVLVASLRWRIDGLFHLPDFREYFSIRPLVSR
jgi:hypothetical protein